MYLEFYTYFHQCIYNSFELYLDIIFYLVTSFKSKQLCFDSSIKFQFQQSLTSLLNRGQKQENKQYRAPEDVAVVKKPNYSDDHQTFFTQRSTAIQLRPTELSLTLAVFSFVSCFILHFLFCFSIFSIY